MVDYEQLIPILWQAIKELANLLIISHKSDL